MLRLCKNGISHERYSGGVTKEILMRRLLMSTVQLVVNGHDIWLQGIFGMSYSGARMLVIEEEVFGNCIAED